LIHVLTKLLLKYLNQILGTDWMLIVVILVLVELHIRAVSIQYAALLQAKEAPLCAEFMNMRTKLVGSKCLWVAL
jgi:hypothetical protein